MRRVQVDAFFPDAAALAPALEAFSRGEIVGYPTETLYGLGVDPSNRTAVSKLFVVKGRSKTEPIPLIASDLEQVDRDIGTLPLLARRLAQQFWPGPLALIIQAHSTIIPEIHSGTQRVAVRVPAHAVARELARLAGHPLTSTSANRSGEPPASTAEEVERALGALLAVLIDAGPAPGRVASTIVDVSTSPPRLVRAGAVPWDRVLEFL
jgi:L-threonylcarbamoyladenylate synthase